MPDDLQYLQLVLLDGGDVDPGLDLLTQRLERVFARFGLRKQLPGKGVAGGAGGGQYLTQLAGVGQEGVEVFLLQEVVCAPGLAEFVRGLGYRVQLRRGPGGGGGVHVQVVVLADDVGALQLLAEVHLGERQRVHVVIGPERRDRLHQTGAALRRVCGNLALWQRFSGVHLLQIRGAARLLHLLLPERTGGFGEGKLPSALWLTHLHVGGVGLLRTGEEGGGWDGQLRQTGDLEGRFDCLRRI